MLLRLVVVLRACGVVSCSVDFLCVLLCGIVVFCEHVLLLCCVVLTLFVLLLCCSASLCGVVVLLYYNLVSYNVLGCFIVLFSVQHCSVAILCFAAVFC